jgi:flagellar hook-associated protein 2
MGPIGSFSGLASGIQWRDMIDEIIRLERVRRVDPLNNRIGTHQKQSNAWKGFQTSVTRLQNASRALSEGTAFGAFGVSVGTTPGGRSLLTATASTSAQAGSYQIEVRQLATAEKVASPAHASATEPLGLVGTPDPDGAPQPLSFSINGASIQIAANASLNGVRDAINAANRGADASGVSATVLTTAPGEHRLILTSERTGADGIRMSDGEDGPLGQLGLAAGTESARFTSASTSLAGLLGLPAPPEVRTIVIAGQEITVDLTTDTLQTVLSKLQQASPAIPGSIREESGDGGTAYRLQIDAEVTPSTVDGEPDPASQRIIDLLGLRAAPNHAIAGGSDARIAIDGFEVVRPSNVISETLPGVTLNLTHAEPGSTVDVRIERDDAATIAAVKAFVAAYNEVAAFTRTQSGAGQPLASNGSLRTAMGSLNGVLLNPAESTSGERHRFERASLIGVTLTREGTLAVDEPALRAALASDREGVRGLFTGRGSGDDRVPGLAESMERAATAITRTGDGLVASQLESLQRSSESLTARIEAAEGRLELRYASLVQQYARMEEALSTIQSQSAWLSSQIQSLQPRRDR